MRGLSHHQQRLVAWHSRTYVERRPTRQTRQEHQRRHVATE